MKFEAYAEDGDDDELDDYDCGGDLGHDDDHDDDDDEEENNFHK